jgi:hypothetical protein
MMAPFLKVGSCPGARRQPSCWGFVQAYPLQPKLVTVSVEIGGIEDAERFGRQVFHGGHHRQHHGLVFGQRRQKRNHSAIALVHQEGMIPVVDQHCIGHGFHV